MAPPGKPPKPEFDDCDETSIQCTWKPEADCSYILQYKEFPDEWEEAQQIEIPVGQGSAQTSNIEELNPTSTYTLRLVAVRNGEQSEPSEVLTVDTQAPGCTPKPGDKPKKSCVVM